MGTRLRHRLRKLWAAGELKVAGRAPAWVFQAIPPQEASPGEVQEYLETQAAPQSAVMPEGYCVGIHKKSGRVLFSGASCLNPEEWDIVKTGTREECSAYANQC
jgi:hypothetical protein